MTAKRPSHADLSRALGLSRGRITQMAARGMPLFSAEAAAAWRAQNVAPRAGSATKAASVVPAPERPAGTPVAYDASRARREAAEAELAELRLASERGDLIQVLAVQTVWATALATTRERLLQIPARLGQELAAESDAFVVQQRLEVEIHQALHALAGGSMQPAPASPEGAPA